jgi:hypothetical protein
MRKSIFIITISLLLAISPFSVAQAGIKTVHTKEQTLSTWGVGTATSDIDGSITHFIFKNHESNGTYYYRVDIECKNKKLEFFVSGFDLPIDGKVDSKGYGITQVKIDAGKGTNFKYMSSDETYSIKILSPKSLTTALLKGNKKVTFKVESSSMGNQIIDISIGDLKKYEVKFKSLGCPLK